MRGVHLAPQLDVESIVSPSKSVWAPGGWAPYLKGFWAELRSITPRVGDAVLWEKYHLTTKAAPGGGHALLEGLSELWCLPSTLLDSLRVLGGKGLSDRLDWLLANRPVLDEVFGSTEPRPIRKLQAISDSEGKSRVIALLDYWSQTALYPLHLFIFKILEKIPQDVTFNQGSFIDKVKHWKHGVWYSVDLSKATDRFPIDLISLVLEGRFSLDYVTAWRRVMVGFAFQTAAGPVQYSVGNPMGAYSSWASFALAHHFVMYRVSKELRRPWRTLPYVVLGDDILIGEARVGETYLGLISSLGVEFSASKSYISNEVSEFAKRILLTTDLTEISPFPISGIADATEVSLVVSTIREAERKGYSPNRGIPAAVSGLFQALAGPRKDNPRKWASIQARAYLCDVSTRFLSGGLTSGDFFAAICGPSGRGFTSSEVDSFLKVILANAFAKSLVGGPDSYAALSDRILIRV